MRLLLLFVFISCSTPKNTYEKNSNDVKQIVSLPIWMEYSKNVPDSIKDFMKVYFESRQHQIITMKEAIELLIGQGNTIFMNNLPTGNNYEADYIAKLEKMRKPICNFLVAEMYKKETRSELIIDSIRWFIIQKPSTDTNKIYHLFYPLEAKQNDPYLVLRDFADTVLVSGLLK